MEEKVKSKGGSFCSVTVNCLLKSSLYHGNCHFIFSPSEVRKYAGVVRTSQRIPPDEICLSEAVL